MTTCFKLGFMHGYEAYGSVQGKKYYNDKLKLKKNNRVFNVNNENANWVKVGKEDDDWVMIKNTSKIHKLPDNCDKWEFTEGYIKGYEYAESATQANARLLEFARRQQPPVTVFHNGALKGNRNLYKTYRRNYNAKLRERVYARNFPRESPVAAAAANRSRSRSRSRSWSRRRSSSSAPPVKLHAAHNGYQLAPRSQSRSRPRRRSSSSAPSPM